MNVTNNDKNAMMPSLLNVIVHHVCYHNQRFDQHFIISYVCGMVIAEQPEDLELKERVDALQKKLLTDFAV
jgi:hypothetical protein